MMYSRARFWEGSWHDFSQEAKCMKEQVNTSWKIFSPSNSDVVKRPVIEKAGQLYVSWLWLAVSLIVVLPCVTKVRTVQLSLLEVKRVIADVHADTCNIRQFGRGTSVALFCWCAVHCRLCVISGLSVCYRVWETKKLLLWFSAILRWHFHSYCQVCFPLK